jgi:hypothetical protein
MHPSSLNTVRGKAAVGLDLLRQLSLNVRIAFAALTLRRRCLGDGGGQIRAKGYKRSVDMCGQRLHARGCSEGDKRNHQRVLDQVLALFALQRIFQKIYLYR